jgi:hypothetical protein
MRNGRERREMLDRGFLPAKMLSILVSFVNEPGNSSKRKGRGIRLALKSRKEKFL